MTHLRQQATSSRRGFTLAELVIAATVSLFVVMVSLGLLITMLESEAKSYNKISMDQEASDFLTALTRDTQAAQRVYAVNGADALTADDRTIYMDLLRFGGAIESVSYSVIQLGESDEFYIQRVLTDASGTVLSTKDYFKLDGKNGEIGMVKMQAVIDDATITHTTAYYDSQREVIYDPDQVRFIRWEFPLYYEASTMTFNRKVRSPLIMMRNKTS